MIKNRFKKFLERGDYNDACFRAKSIVRGLKRDFDIDTIKYAFKSVLDEESMKESKSLRNKSRRVKEAVGYNGEFWKGISEKLKDILGEGEYSSWDGRSVSGYWSFNKGYAEVRISANLYDFYEYIDEDMIKNKDFYPKKGDDVSTALKRFVNYSLDAFMSDKEITFDEFFNDGEYESDFTGSGYLWDDAPYFRIKFIHEDGSRPQHLKDEDDEEQCIYAFCDLCYGYDTVMSDVYEEDIIFKETDGEEEVTKKILEAAKVINDEIEPYATY